MQCIKLRIHQDNKLDTAEEKISRQPQQCAEKEKKRGEIKEKNTRRVWKTAKESNIHVIKVVLCFDFRQTWVESNLPLRLLTRSLTE